jgi:hypothetical protein
MPLLKASCMTIYVSTDERSMQARIAFPIPHSEPGQCHFRSEIPGSPTWLPTCNYCNPLITLCGAQLAFRPNESAASSATISKSEMRCHEVPLRADRKGAASCCRGRRCAHLFAQRAANADRLMPAYICACNTYPLGRGVPATTHTIHAPLYLLAALIMHAVACN